MAIDNKTPKWLIDTEQNSWQIELLISGGFVFVLFQFPDFIRDQLVTVVSYSDVGTSTIMLFIGAVILTRVLLIGFIINLLFRAIWLAYLGIHYALVMMFLVFLLIEQSDSLTEILDNSRVGITMLFLLLLVSFGALDRIYFGFLKHKSKASDAYYPIGKILSYLNLSSIFRYEWFTLISNVSRWKIHGAVFSYFMLALIITINDLDFKGDVFDQFTGDFFDDRKFKNIPATAFYIQNAEYDDLIKKEDGKVNVASIPSENITGNNLPLFINYKYFFDRSLEVKFINDSIVSSQRANNFTTPEEYQENADKLMSALNNTFQVKVDDNLIKDSKWFLRRHPLTDQVGFFTRIDISNLRYGDHELDIRLMGVNKEMEKDTFFLSWIPFWKE